MAKLGSMEHPVILRSPDEARVHELFKACTAHGLHCIVGYEPDKPEDISDLKRALKTFRPQVQAKPHKVSPNDYCPCGSNKKYKNCCGKA
jgi:SWIM/SEC-C metal-binding protein